MVDMSLFARIKKILFGKLRKATLVGFDCVCFACLAALFLLASYVFDPKFDYDVLRFVTNAGILLVFILLSRSLFGLYNTVWRYTRTMTQFKLVIADALGMIAAGLFSWICGLYIGFWFFVILAPINALLTLVSRYCYRLLYKVRNASSASEGKQIPVAIVGAGQIGSYLANELFYSQKYNYQPVMFIDKDPQKIGGRLAGLKIYAETPEILEVLRKNGVEEIFVALSNIDSTELSQMFEFYSPVVKRLKLYDVPVKDLDKDGKSAARSIRNFEIEDLLFRKALKINNSKTVEFYSGKTVLITGGGGSIGSELCRQIAACAPKKLIILDIYENNAYEIQQQLIRKYGDKLSLAVEIASVRDRARLDAIFEYYKPDIVFHAAAHKHVPLMEHSGLEAIKNNIFGTKNTADMAEKHGAERFILISTDKAVNPTNVMGASKRMCEMIVQSRVDSATRFAAVRFGNVLGSNGSVIPLFREQIAQGGPVTITDKRIIRYFMTIPEASQLVMQAGAMAKQGELFVLDMGKPIRIYDLAVNMIKLSGYEPEVDIEIKEIGLRPGEKLYEELLIKTETLTQTENKMIFIEKDLPLSRAEIEDKLDLLGKVAFGDQSLENTQNAKLALKETVPTFRDPEEINKDAQKSEEMAAANA